MRILFAIAAAAASLFATLPANAATAYFSLTGARTVEFSLPVSPTTSNSIFTPDPFADGLNFSIVSTATVDGIARDVNLNFYPLDGGGGLDVSRLDADDYFTPAGPVLFSGSIFAPTFLAGTYDLEDYFVPGIFYTLTIRTDGVAAVPEPATWAMMVLGIGLVGASLRRKSGQQSRPSALRPA